MFERRSHTFDTNFVEQEPASVPPSTQHEAGVVPDFSDPKQTIEFLGRVFGYVPGDSDRPEEKNMIVRNDDGQTIQI